VTSRPSISTRPSVGISKPAMIRRRVVLPQPDGPRIEKNAPGAIASDTPASDGRSAPW
jgi:hypothetical protein